MTAPTIYLLAEEIKRLLDGSDIPVASSIHINEIKLSVGQVANALLKADYFQTNARWGEMIPNGTMIAYYENIVVEKWQDRSRAKLPIKPLKLPRDMGVWAVFPSGYPDREIIPVEMGQWSLLQSQPLINDAFGQLLRETYGDYVVFNKDITVPGEDVTVDMRLAVMDVTKYGDYDLLPILPEMVWEIKKQVYALYSTQPIPDKLVDSSVKENKGVPLKEQSQS